LNGVIGSEVPSNKGSSGLKHFVTFKSAGDPAVVLKADNVPAGLKWGQDIEWRINGNPGVGLPGDDAKMFIARDNTGRYEVTLWDKHNDKALDTYIVWVIWAEITGGPTPHAFPPANTPTAPLFYAGVFAGTRIQYDMLSTAHISPASMFDLSQDVPDLTASLNGDPSLTGIDPVTLDPLSNGVNALWDMSRRKAIRAGIQTAFSEDHAYLPMPGDPLMDYPTNPVEGNDDSATNDESNNPYAPGHLGELTMSDNVIRDGPGPAILQNGYLGDFYTSKVWFQDFARVKLGNVWYVISDPNSWRVEFHFRKLPITESMWGMDADGDGFITGRTIWEDDAAMTRIDFNGNGLFNDSVAYWDQDPAYNSFTQHDNSGIPARGQ
jgi:hypothetical protein